MINSKIASVAKHLYIKAFGHKKRPSRRGTAENRNVIICLFFNSL